MQRRPMSAVVVASAICSILLPDISHAGWITLSAGVSGNTQSTTGTEFWYSSPATPSVAVNQLSGTGTVTAGTGGGLVFFSGLGTPVVLNLSDGSAYISGGSPPAGATSHGPAGGSAGTPASRAPQASGPIPTDAILLGLWLAPGTDGTKVLTVGVSASSGTGLGSGTLDIPVGGWWIIGLGPSQEPSPIPLPDPEPIPPPLPVPTPSPAPGVPEPATLALVAWGALFVLPRLRRFRRPVPL
jgi:hypothetical protein